MSSLVVSGPTGNLKLTNGQTLAVAAVLKSALTEDSLVLTSSVAGSLPVINASGERVPLFAKAFGSYAGSDRVLVVTGGATAAALGADRQPIPLFPIAEAQLVP